MRVNEQVININNSESLTTFTCTKLDSPQTNADVWIGAEMSGKRYRQHMHGDLAALEIYVNESAGPIPDSLKNLITRDQIVVIKGEPSPKKKKRK